MFEIKLSFSSWARRNFLRGGGGARLKKAPIWTKRPLHGEKSIKKSPKKKKK